jgi:hypothetical protein
MPMPGSQRVSAPLSDTTMHDQTHPRMMKSGALGIPMDRMGSGTTWIPDAVSLPSHHFAAGGWDLMVHGFVFGQYNTQGGRRGNHQIGSLNWGMLMATHRLAGGVVQLRTMLSLDPATVTPRGYPLLLQSGEAYNGVPLHDRQHPHDFFMELGALFDKPVSKNVGVEIYASPSGEPALGPVAFMHRPSAMDEPVAPIAHHWQDATHISFGVVTAGLFTKQWKLEGSIFNGREPDQNRWGFDRIRLDSYSGRLTFNPDSQWSLSVGYGYLRSPEALTPDESQHRVVASLQHGARFGRDGQWATTFVYGANAYEGQSRLSNSALLESELVLNRSNTLFARAELVEKSADDLALTDSVSTAGAAPFVGSQRFNVGSFSIGYIREMVHGHGVTLGIGGEGILSAVPASIEPFYGSRTPVAGLVFLRLRPEAQRDQATRHDAQQMHGMQ